MIVNPIIPIWLMTIICVILIILIIYSKQLKEKITNKQNNEKQLGKKEFNKTIYYKCKYKGINSCFIIYYKFKIYDSKWRNDGNKLGFKCSICYRYKY